MVFPFVDVNECGSNPCQNDAECVDGDEYYSCTCVTGWAGVNCENGKYNVTLKTPHKTVIE